MTTTPTPVERVAAAILDVHEDGPDAWVEARVALSAALDVDEIARVLGEHRPRNSFDGTECLCGHADETGIDFNAHQAAALIAHLTQTGATR